MPFEKGNQAAKNRQSPKEFASMLRLAIKEAHSEGADKLRAVADALVTKAIAGDVNAIKEVADRLDGKVPQAIAGDPNNPIEANITHKGEIGLSGSAALIAEALGGRAGRASKESGEG